MHGAREEAVPLRSGPDVKSAERKKLIKSFSVGDEVTWGNRSSSHIVVECTDRGLYVDINDDENARWFASRTVNGRYHLFVSFDENNRNKSGRGPITLVKSAKIERDVIF